MTEHVERLEAYLDPCMRECVEAEQEFEHLEAPLFDRMAAEADVAREQARVAELKATEAAKEAQEYAKIKAEAGAEHAAAKACAEQAQAELQEAQTLLQQAEQAEHEMEEAAAQEGSAGGTQTEGAEGGVAVAAAAGEGAEHAQQLMMEAANLEEEVKFREARSWRLVKDAEQLEVLAVQRAAMLLRLEKEEEELKAEAETLRQAVEADADLAERDYQAALAQRQQLKEHFSEEAAVAAGALAERADIKATGAQLSLETAITAAIKVEQAESALTQARRDVELLLRRTTALVAEAEDLAQGTHTLAQMAYEKACQAHDALEAAKTSAGERVVQQAPPPERLPAGEGVEAVRQRFEHIKQVLVAKEEHAAQLLEEARRHARASIVDEREAGKRAQHVQRVLKDAVAAHGKEKEALGRVEDLVQEAREETDTRLQQHWPGLIQGYRLLIKRVFTLALLPLVFRGLLHGIALHNYQDLSQVWGLAKQTHLTVNLVTFALCCLLLVVVAATYIATRSRPVYLLGYHCYKPPPEYKVTYAWFMQQARDSRVFDKKSLALQEKVLERSGLGEETYLPWGLKASPPVTTLATAREEAEEVIFTAVAQALAATGTQAHAVDILIVNCSLFNPIPSLSAMVVNRFKMRTDVLSYNLAGMGCSAGVISLGLAQQLLQVHPNSTALVVSTENITQNCYFGNDRSMCISNCLFRMGGAALVLSNRRTDWWRANYELLHVVRTHMGQDDAHYGCVYQRQDEAGNKGVHLSKTLMSTAGHALKANITTLGPLVLPLSEQLLFFANLVARKGLGFKMRPYIPDFKLAFDHFCIHTGGRGVIDAIESQLELTPSLVGPSRESLYRYGNISSASIWYVLGNIETKRGVRRGDRVWQISFGSGFKCNSAVWRALRNVNCQHPAWVE